MTDEAVQPSRTFRIFVSSTFSDLKAERDALQRFVFPRLRELCARHGGRFQAIDLRWGVSEEAAFDQRTMSICLGEIERCQRTTPRPNFLVLLGERYGWRPLPAEIPADELEQIAALVTGTGEKALLETWYRLDENAAEPVYCLQPRHLEMPQTATTQARQAAQDAEATEWTRTESRLREILLRAVAGLALDEESRLKYEASATEQEIVRGALHVPDAAEHVFCFFRTLTTTQGAALAEQAPGDGNARDFIDQIEVDGRFVLDTAAHGRLARLKEDKLRGLLADHVYDYAATWNGAGINEDHLGYLPGSLDECLDLLHDPEATGTLCVDVWRALATTILRQLEQVEQVDPLEAEIWSHQEFGRERARHFTGREQPLAAVAEYLSAAAPCPFAFLGEPGSGKSALMAKAAQEARTGHPHAVTLVRFIGATPASGDGRSLLDSLCREISRAYSVDESDVPSEYNDLVVKFATMMKLASPTRPLIVFLDALDQLAGVGRALDQLAGVGRALDQLAGVGRALAWLPGALPTNVRVVLSTLPGDWERARQAKHPYLEPVVLEAMSSHEGEELLGHWLEQAGRTLQRHQEKEVLEKFARTGLPFYLKLAFEESRVWKSYSPVSETFLPSAPADLINQLLTRLARRSTHGPILVSHVLGYLAAARDGLTEDELLDVLSGDDAVVDRIDEGLQIRYELLDGVLADLQSHAAHKLSVKRLPDAPWSRLLLDLDPYLTRRNVDDGLLLTFTNALLLEAVKKRFLDDSIRKERHHVLANYFLDKLWARRLDHGLQPNLHVFSELPHHLAQGEMWPELTELLVDPDYFAVSCDLGHEYELMNYWQQVRRLATIETPIPLKIRIDIPGLYRQAWSGLDESIRCAAIGRLGHFLRILGFQEAAEDCLREEEAYLARHGERGVDAASNHNERGLLLIDRGNPDLALVELDQALRALDGVSMDTPEDGAAEATILMNMARANEELGNHIVADSLISRARDRMGRTAGPTSPETATVIQTMGNFAVDRGELEAGLRLHREAYRIRSSVLRKGHFDLGVSLFNLARTEILLKRFLAAVAHAEEAIDIFTESIGRDGAETRQARSLIDYCTTRMGEAERNLSGWGFVLLLVDTQASTEDPPDPREVLGAAVVAREIVGLLVTLWDDMVAHGSAIPILVVCCPGYEQAMHLAMAQKPSTKVPARLLHWLTEPPVDAHLKSKENMHELHRLSGLRKEFEAWAESRGIRILMVRPIGNTGTLLERQFLERFGEDERALAFDIVPFDGVDGPLLGLSKAGGESRPAIMPAHAWKEQFVPREGDSRATGTVYLNLPLARLQFRKTRKTWNFRKKGPLDAPEEWFAETLISMATAPFEKQKEAFEQALANLIGLVKARPINCPSEMGQRRIGQSRSVHDCDDDLS